MSLRQQQSPPHSVTSASADLEPPRAGAQAGATGRARVGIEPEPSPPSANRGAEMTLPPANRSLIDWLAVTFKVDDPHDAIRIIGLPTDLFTPLPRGFSGYRKSLRCGNITVFYEGQKEMGCHVEMSGQGCRQYEGHHALSWPELFFKVLAVSAHVTRLDLALDIVDGSLPLDRLTAAVNRGEVRTLFSEWKRIEKGSFHAPDTNQGETLYLGSTRSSTFFRVYDKAKESQVEGSWIRFELELRQDRADQAAMRLGGGMTSGALAAGIVNHYFAVIQLDDSNISRCTLAPWWERWLFSTEKIRLGRAPTVKTVDDTMAFIKQQYAPSLAMIERHLGGTSFRAYLRDVLDNGSERLSAKHEQMLRATQPDKQKKPAWEDA